MSDLTEDQKKAAEVALQDMLCKSAVDALRKAHALHEQASNMENTAKKILEERFNVLGAKEVIFDGDTIALVGESVGHSFKKDTLKELLLKRGISVSEIAAIIKLSTKETPKATYIMFRPKSENTDTA